MIEVSKLGILNNNMMIYVQNKDGSNVVEGVIRSFCGLTQNGFIGKFLSSSACLSDSGHECGRGKFL